MTNVFLYYGFNPFFKDTSGVFSENDICYSELNSEHFLVFEKKEEDIYNLYVSKYASEKEIGIHPPEIIETLIENYDKSIPEHRIAIRRYFQ
jgi:hypothetical protein